MNNTNPNLILVEKREAIIRIDAGILSLLDKRMHLAIEIARLKKETGRDIEDLERETELLSVILQHNRDTLMEDQKVAEIWRAIFKLSKDIQEEATKTAD